MRVTAFVFALLLSIPGAVAAQEWEEYQPPGRLQVELPRPAQSDDGINWTSQLNYVLPGAWYSAEKGPERYSITVVDYSGIEQQGIERAKSCPPGN